MGRTILCNSCKSTFDENVLASKENPHICPVCGASLLAEDDAPSHNEPLSFGDGVELGENDSFDEDKIDFWWYEISEPNKERTIRGQVHTTCAKCGNLTGTAPYYIAKTGDYLLIDQRFRDRCGTCGNEMKNHILLKRPAEWVDPRPLDMWKKDYSNLPKCITCGSVNIKKISTASKAASVAMWGLLSRKVHKQWHCNICGSEW